jgi:hypothetical protein
MSFIVPQGIDARWIATMQYIVVIVFFLSLKKLYNT